MNLSQSLDTSGLANQGAVLELRDANGAPIQKTDGSPVTITLLGADSDVAVRHSNGVMNRRLAQGPRAKLTAEALEADAVALLVKCTAGWDGVGIDEDETAFTPEAAARLYHRFPAVREQVDVFIADRSNFLPPSAKTSAPTLPLSSASAD